MATPLRVRTNHRIDQIFAALRDLRAELAVRRAEVESLERISQVQLERIAQIQAELDDVRRTQAKASLPSRRKHQ